MGQVEACKTLFVKLSNLKHLHHLKEIVIIKEKEFQKKILENFPGFKK